jgi:hypothetical protein
MPNKQVSELKKIGSGVSDRKRHHQMSSSRSNTTNDEDDSSLSESDIDGGCGAVSGGGGRRKAGNRNSAASGGGIKQKGSSASSMSRSHSGRLQPENKKSPYAPEKYSSPDRSAGRKSSAPSAMSKSMTASSSSSSRPTSAPTSKGRQGRATTRSVSVVENGSAGVNGNSGREDLSEKSMKNGVKLKNKILGPTPPRNYNAAATVIQKNWKGHAIRNNDDKIHDLKKEVRELRSEEHIKYLTKELSTAKSALDQERKFRALQMDAIKVLWKEVQMMDATKGGKDADKPRPSGSHGSKISSR